MHRRHLPGLHAGQSDAEERQPVVEFGRVGAVAAQPVQGLDDGHIEPLRRGVDLPLLGRRPKATGAAQRRVGVTRRLPARLVGEAPAHLDLVLDRRRAHRLRPNPARRAQGVRDRLPASRPGLLCAPRRRRRPGDHRQRLLSPRQALPRPAGGSGSGTSGPSPARPGPTARPSASSGQPSGNGPMPSPV